MTAEARATFPTRPGRAYELRIALRGETPRPEGVSLTSVTLDFETADGAPADARRLAELDAPDADAVLRIETLGAGLDVADARAREAATALRYVVAPADAARAVARISDPGMRFAHFEARPLRLDWPREAAEAATALEASCAAQAALLARVAPPSTADAEARAVAQHTPALQFRALARAFEPMGRWRNRPPREVSAETPLRRLIAAQRDRPRIGFIGGERTYRMLGAFAEIVALREAEWRAQLAALPLEGVVIETTPESMFGDWRAAFGRLDGAMSAEARALIEAARARAAPTRLFVSSPPAEDAMFGAACGAVDAVIFEGAPEERPDAPPDAHFAPRAIEPALIPPFGVDREPGAILCASGSDVFHHAALRNALRALPLRALRVTEFDYGFYTRSVDELLSARGVAIECPVFAERARLLAQADIVVLAGESVRDTVETERAAMDAVSAGAMPLLFGRPQDAGALLRAVPCCETVEELFEQLRLLSEPWWRERRWRRLWRIVGARHLWRSADRRALLGRDPAPEELDEPLVSAVVASKRPHLIPQLLDWFRAQSHGPRELVVVMNCPAPELADLALRPGERIFTLPESRNVGACLNHAIAVSSGAYWTKIDDDDHYSRFYLEELALAFRATGAEAVGRQAVFFHMSGEDMSCARRDFFGLTLRHRRFVAGATLSARRSAGLPGFSPRMRNAMDSAWLRDLEMRGIAPYAYDSTSIVVHREADPRAHTWSGPLVASKRFPRFCSGLATRFLERGS